MLRTTELREATPADTEHLIGMMRQLWTTDTASFNEQLSRQCLAMMLSDQSLGRVWMINGEEGYIVLTFGFSLEFGRDAFIDELFLSAPHRGRGTGTAVIELVAEKAAQLGVKALHLEVSDANDKAKALYVRKSFKLHGRRLMTRWLTTETQSN